MKYVILSVAALVMAGCASSYPPPNQGLADAQSAKRSAEELGATGEPKAQLHLRLADEEIAQAKAAMSDGDNKRATFLLVRARADAELALALAREQGAQADARRLVDQLNTWRSANSTNSNQGAQP
jgi:Domain of unknown function (DUF4398)